jgi:hypothetical protein
MSIFYYSNLLVLDLIFLSYMFLYIGKRKHVIVTIACLQVFITLSLW